MLPNVITCTYNQIQRHEEIQSRFAQQFNIWKNNIVNKYFFIKLLQSNGVTIRLIDYYIRDNIEGIRFANYFIYVQDNVIYTEKLVNYISTIPIQLYNSYIDFETFDIKMTELIQSLSKYLENQDPSPFLMCNVIYLNCTLDMKYPKNSSDCYFESIVTPILNHVTNTSIHLCENERQYFNSKLSETCAKQIYSESIHSHDYEKCGLQTITVNNISYCSIGSSYFNITSTGIQIILNDNTISFNII